MKIHSSSIDFPQLQSFHLINIPIAIKRPSIRRTPKRIDKQSLINTLAWTFLRHERLKRRRWNMCFFFSVRSPMP